MKSLMHVWRLSAMGAGLICGLALSVSHFSPILNFAHAAGSASNGEEEYDRLDGMGASGKKVNVIEWEGNLEIHVYPAGSLKGLALTIDRKTKDKPVMVIGYRFADNPKKQIIRRAIIDGISLSDDFKTYRDPSADGYDKVVITNNNLDKVLVAYKLEPKPSQLYPDGHPALMAQEETNAPRKPAALGVNSTGSSSAQAEQAAADQEELQESGTIRPFMMNEHHGGGRNR